MTPSPGRMTPKRDHPGRYLVVLAVATVAGLVALGVLPARTYLDQGRERDRIRAELEALDADNAELTARLEVLASDEEIERLARERHQLVMPGEEAYNILPDPATAPR